jgi:hypothetical protein
MKEGLFIVFLSFSLMSFSGNLVPKQLQIFGNTCTLVAQLAYNLAISEGADHPTAVQASNIAYNNCINTHVK